MKSLFLDTNIVLDLLAHRMPFYNEAAKLFSLADKKKIKLSISALCLADSNYILSKQLHVMEVRKILRKFKVKKEQICFMGDDLIDIPILKRVGLAITVPNAMREVKDVAHHITDKEGGRGAVREVCEMLLKAQGKWENVTRKYFE